MFNSIFAGGSLTAGSVLLVLGLLLFGDMGRDKRRARTRRRRIPEAELFLLALLGGAWGGWLGMGVFHHKTRHRAFSLGFPLLTLLQLAGLLYLFWRG